MSLPEVPLGEPLARAAGAPAVYSVLGAVFHLELLTPDDEPRLAAAVEICERWIGSHLRWTNRSCDEWITRYRIVPGLANLHWRFGFTSSLHLRIEFPDFFAALRFERDHS